MRREKAYSSWRVSHQRIAESVPLRRTAGDTLSAIWPSLQQPGVGEASLSSSILLIDLCSPGVRPGKACCPRLRQPALEGSSCSVFMVRTCRPAALTLLTSAIDLSAGLCLTVFSKFEVEPLHLHEAASANSWLICRHEGRGQPAGLARLGRSASCCGGGLALQRPARSQGRAARRAAPTPGKRGAGRRCGLAHDTAAGSARCETLAAGLTNMLTEVHLVRDIVTSSCGMHRRP